MNTSARGVVSVLGIFGLKDARLWDMLYHYPNIFLASGKNVTTKDTSEPLPPPRSVLIKRLSGEFCVVHPDNAKSYRIFPHNLFTHAGKIYLAWDGEKVIGGGGTYTTPDGWDDGDGGFIPAGKYAGQTYRLPTVIERFTVDPEVFECLFAPKASARLFESFSDHKIGRAMCSWPGVPEMIKAQTP